MASGWPGFTRSVQRGDDSASAQLILLCFLSLLPLISPWDFIRLKLSPWRSSSGRPRRPTSPLAPLHAQPVRSPTPLAPPPSTPAWRPVCASPGSLAARPWRRSRPAPSARLLASSSRPLSLALARGCTSMWPAPGRRLALGPHRLLLAGAACARLPLGLGPGPHTQPRPCSSPHCRAPARSGP